jgi:hypothetical protein
MIKSLKSEHEKSVFLDFAEAAGLPVDPLSLESCREPEPDIRVGVEHETVYYELGRILDDYMQERRREGLKKAPTQVSVNPSRAGLPERDRLQLKLLKPYSTNGLPLELLLYYDSETPWVLGGIPPLDFNVFASHVMEPLLTPMPSHIRRVWVFDAIATRSCGAIPLGPRGRMPKHRRPALRVWRRRRIKSRPAILMMLPLCGLTLFQIERERDALSMVVECARLTMPWTSAYNPGPIPSRTTWDRGS